VRQPRARLKAPIRLAPLKTQVHLILILRSGVANSHFHPFCTDLGIAAQDTPSIIAPSNLAETSGSLPERQAVVRQRSGDLGSPPAHSQKGSRKKGRGAVRGYTAKNIYAICDPEVRVTLRELATYDWLICACPTQAGKRHSATKEVSV
jgi:hypothetical protein